MHIVVVPTFAEWAPHFGTDLELIERHLDAGDSVTVIVIPGHLHCPEYCYTVKSPRYRWWRYNSYLKNGLAIFGGKINVVWITGVPRPRKHIQAQFIGELMSLTHGTFDLGMGIASSLISLSSKAYENLAGLEGIANGMWAAGSTIYDEVKDVLATLKPDRLYVFNGRFFQTRAVVRAAEASGIECWTHERGCDRFHYSVYPRTLPHDRDFVQSEARKAWDSAAANSERVQIGESFYEERVSGKEQGWYSFTSLQAQTLLPETWDMNETNIVCYNSSEDEFIAIGPSWDHDEFPSQSGALSEFAVAVRTLNPGIRIWLRQHPRLVEFPEQAKEFARLAELGIDVIPPESPVSSYQMMKHCDKVVTFGSTAGIEAAYWGKPSILLWPSLYDGLGSCQRVATKEAVVAAIVAESVSPPKEGALVYGYYLKTFGIRFDYYEPHNLGTGCYRGRRLGPSMGFQWFDGCLSWLKSLKRRYAS